MWQKGAKRISDLAGRISASHGANPAGDTVFQDLEPETKVLLR